LTALEIYATNHKNASTRVHFITIIITFAHQIRDDFLIQTMA